MESTIPKPENANADSKEDIVDLYRGPDTKLEENASDVESVPYSEGGGDEEEGYEASVATDLEIVSDCEMNAGGVDHPDNTIDDHVPDHDVTEVSPYSLRPRIPHIEGNSSLGSSETSLTQARSPKKSSKHRARNRRRNNQSRVKFNWTLEPVEDPPPDDLESSSLISGEPVIFKLEELEQLRIQLEQHVQLLTQSVVMCYHDRRLAHVKDQYQLMINELDSRYYAGGETSFFNIANLGAAIDSCHDIMVVNPVAQLHVKWEPTDYGWCPRPEAALVLGRSRAVIYPDLLPGVQPDLFDVAHQFFTPGEDLLLAHALIQFRHVPHYNTRNSSGRLNWVQKMSLPCKTISQIRSHLRAAQEHVDGRVVQPNPLYKIIIQALREACHFQFPFERPVVRYETLQMWPEKDRPVWFNKFLKVFTTIGPTLVVPRESVRVCTPPATTACDMPMALISQNVCPTTASRKSRTGIVTSVSFEVDVSFHHDGAHLITGVDVRPISNCYESVGASFPSSSTPMANRCHQNTSEFDDICILKPLASERTNGDIVSDENSCGTPSNRSRSERVHVNTCRKRAANVPQFVSTPAKRKTDCNENSQLSSLSPCIPGLVVGTMSVFSSDSRRLILPCISIDRAPSGTPG